MAGQAVFHKTIRVEFEKTVAVPQLFKEMEPTWYEMIKDRLPNQMLSYFDFISDGNTSLYQPGREVPRDPRFFFQSFADKNTVYNDYTKGTTITQKPVFEETFLVADSLLPIQWHLTPDTRVIAGYECRKAVGIIYDTIAVFAFYSDELLATGGPEGIHGLPGMILGMAIPRLHTTWFATKVEVNGVPTAKIKPLEKGKKVTRAEMVHSIGSVLKRWNTYGEKMMLAFII